MPDGKRGFELSIERQVHGGRGLARLPDGRVALVRGGIPGERVVAALEARKGVLLGEVIDVLESSPDRVAAPRHPGLDMAHVAYSRQLELKRQVVEDALSRATGERCSSPAVTRAPAQWGYRNAVQPAVGHGLGLGYRLPGTDQLVALDDDPSASGTVNVVWSTLLELGVGASREGREAARDLSGGPAAGPMHRGLPRLAEVAIRANDEGEAVVALIGNGPSASALDFAHRLVERGVTGVSWAPFDPRGRFRGGSEKLTGKRIVLQRFGALELSVTATTFSQPNPAAAAELYAELKRWAGTGSAAVDLFAGGGPIAMNLAGSFQGVTAIEVDKGAVERGKRDAERMALRNVEFVRTDARRVSLEPGPELFVVDPPRAGLAAELRAQLAAAVTRRLIYVSCDVATWARDVADLQQRGLRLSRFTPYDFFPQTHHVEVLSLLEAVSD